MKTSKSTRQNTNHASRAKGGRNRASFGSRMVDGLTELRDSLRAGERIEDRFTVRTVALPAKPRRFSARAIRQLRSRLGASQAVFARILGVTANTVQSWEQGVRIPSPMACRFLEEIERNGRYWQGRLRERAVS